MDRKNFISRIGSTAVCVCMGGLAACVKATEVPSNTTSVLQIDLNTQLTTVGDSVSVGSVAVVRIGPGNDISSFSVLSTICPHQGYTVQYFPNEDDPKNADTKGIFRCQGHQSEFTKQGYLIAGLATKDLDKKPFAINNNTLVINT